MKLFAPLVCLAVMLAGCQRNPAPKPAAEYQMRGEVVRLDPAGQLATVKHDKIEGWMGAMTMEYPIKDKQEFTKLKVGEKIQAKILVQGTDYWIATVNEEPAGSVVRRYRCLLALLFSCAITVWPQSPPAVAAVITTDLGTYRIEFAPDKAPKHVAK